MLRPVSVAAATVCALLSQHAHAYVVKGEGWREDRVAFEVDPGLDEHARSALQSAVSAWTGEPEVPALELEHPAAPVPRNGEDRRNVVAVYQEGWPFEQNLLAATVVTRGTLDRRLLSADIYVNAANHDFGPGGFDLQSTLTHEVGHALDLGDEDSAFAAAMYRKLAPGVVKHTISDDDRAGIAEIYGAGGLPGGCVQAALSPLMPVFAVLGILLFARRKRGAAAVLLVVMALGTGGAEADGDAGMQALTDVQGVAGALRGQVVATRRVDVPGAPLPMTELRLDGGECVAGICASVKTVQVWGGEREDGTTVELADQPVPQMGEEILVRVDAHGRSVQRHGATLWFMGRNLLGASVVSVGDRLSWSQHRWEDVAGVMERAFGATAAP